MSTDAERSTHAIVVFDGVCHLCSAWVQFLLHRDRVGRFRFASMQSLRGRALLVEHGVDPDDPVSFLLVDAGRPWTDSDAILRVLDLLGGPWRLARVLRVIPRVLRDPLYRWIARHRYRLFGRREVCWMPAPDVTARFLD